MKCWVKSVSGEDVRVMRSRRSLRRADRYTAMTVAGLLGCEGLDPSALAGADTALVTWSTLGPHATVFATLDDILDFPEDLILPTKFSHSVVNAAASYIGAEFGITGPTFALVGFENVKGEAVRLAESMMSTGMCSRVLVVGVEEGGLLTDVMGRLMPERLEGLGIDKVEVVLVDGIGEGSCAG